jgi:hypothetical protein
MPLEPRVIASKLKTEPKRPPQTIVWEPQPRQALLLSCPVFEVLYGGARGGG